MKTKLKTFIQKFQTMSILFAVLLCAGIVFVGVMAQGGKNVSASTSSMVKVAKLSEKNKKARKAYQKLLAKKEFQRTKEKKFTYAVIDLDGNGIDELFIDSGGNCMANMYYQLYTFQKGKVKKLLEIYRVPFIVYEDGTLRYYMGHMDHIEDTYYKLKNGTLHKLMRLYGFWPDSIPKSKRKNAEYNGNMYWTIRKVGKKQVSYDDCQKWIQKFQTKHKTIKVKYYKNTVNNRKSLCKQV